MLTIIFLVLIIAAVALHLFNIYVVPFANTAAARPRARVSFSATLSALTALAALITAILIWFGFIHAPNV